MKRYFALVMVLACVVVFSGWERYFALVMVLACVVVFSGRGVAQAEEESLYDRGLEVVQIMTEMTRTEGYIELSTGDSEIKSIIQHLAEGSYSAPAAVYSLSASVEDLAQGTGLDSLDGVSDDLRAVLARRLFSAFAMRINSMGGAVNLAAANLCAVQKTFVSETFEGNVIYLYTYADAAPVAITFSAGDDHTVSADGVFILCDDFPCASADEIERFFSDIAVEVEEVSP